MATNLLLFGEREVVLDVERLSNLFGCLALDHVGDGLACDVQQALDVQVVGGQDELEQSALVDLEELHVPGGYVVGDLLAVLVVLGRRRVIAMVCAPREHLLQYGRVHVGQRNGLLVVVAHAELLQHGLDRVRLLGNLRLHSEHLAVRAL